MCLVISPLISLMEDQVLGLKSAGISAEFLGSAQANCAKVLQMLEVTMFILPETELTTLSHVADLPTGPDGLNFNHQFKVKD